MTALLLMVWHPSSTTWWIRVWCQHLSSVSTSTGALAMHACTLFKDIVILMHNEFFYTIHIQSATQFNSCLPLHSIVTQLSSVGCCRSIFFSLIIPRLYLKWNYPSGTQRQQKEESWSWEDQTPGITLATSLTSMWTVRLTGSLRWMGKCAGQHD